MKDMKDIGVQYKGFVGKPSDVCADEEWAIWGQQIMCLSKHRYPDWMFMLVILGSPEELETCIIVGEICQILVTSSDTLIDFLAMYEFLQCVEFGGIRKNYEKVR